MARSKDKPAPAPATPVVNSQDVIQKYQQLCVSLDSLANAAHVASYAAGQYMQANFPDFKPGDQTFFGGTLARAGAVAAAVARAASLVPEAAEEEAAEDGNAPKRRKRTKTTTPKDPNAPKKPLTAYFAFAKAARQEVVQELSGASNKEITEELATRWANMKENGEQQPFRDQYVIEMQKYNKLIAAYKAKLSGQPLPEEIPEEAEPEEEEEEEAAPPPKPVTPKSTKGRKEKGESSKKKSKEKEKATPKEKSSRKRSTKEVTPPPSAGEEEQQAAAPATKSPRKRKRKTAD
ncbi:hypothetical protein TWF225_007855 [Orbilia oligospora]|uniref:Uncharacterized protein n=1 Tax=Orbilia oligospora TaxID=2813651 RepID=A0A7C8KPE6_ORBOL|nr:hypothetical protein TWF751_008060 [Orbilia oligospora]KAF3178549.1 hypothetical protein TWF225_007855 [Orbilia oligospora]KAF3256089.1 hypothetical protein TWF217_006358 [Orbilia oligospora]KAF3260158.1 hypothetical protein TWF128_003629 [Orbilia oligospora]KAF3285742.1 hypothetical protein TWF132_009107 [Orbilia oligospora]